jgi:hypothetical protein
MNILRVETSTLNKTKLDIVHVERLGHLLARVGVGSLLVMGVHVQGSITATLRHSPPLVATTVPRCAALAIASAMILLVCS